MKIKKTGKKKYPLYIKPKKGHGFYVPAQQNFGDDFVKNHGCSLVGFYIALAFLGKRKPMRLKFLYFKCIKGLRN